MEDDDKIRQLFADFQPPRPEADDDAFMLKLRLRMQAVEMVKEHSAELQRRNRRAVAVAAAVGCLMGCLLALLLPHLRGWLSAIAPETDLQLMLCAVAAAVTCLTAYNAYELTATQRLGRVQKKL